jgi:uroporphyrinogen-III synthase
VFPGATIALQPEADFRAAGLLAAFADVGVRGDRILLPVSSRGRDELAIGLRERGAQVDTVVAYRTVGAEGLREAVNDCLREGFDLLTFASPSAVEEFVAAGGERLRGRRAAVIGPTTRAAAQAAGLEVVAEAVPPGTEGLVRAILAFFARPGPPHS